MAKGKEAKWTPEKPARPCSCYTKGEKKLHHGKWIREKEPCGRPAEFRVAVSGTLARLSFDACASCAKDVQDETAALLVKEGRPADTRKVTLEKIPTEAA